jgi:hypothetical protein
MAQVWLLSTGLLQLNVVCYGGRIPRKAGSLSYLAAVRQPKRRLADGPVSSHLPLHPFEGVAPEADVYHQRGGREELFG